MKFPRMRPQGAHRLTVPDLAGGINLRDGISEVLDNQLTEAKNIWYQDGVLKTRPGVYTNDFLTQEVVRGGTEKHSFRDFPNITRAIDSKKYYLRVRTCFSVFEGHPTETHTQVLRFFWCNATSGSLEFGENAYISFLCSKEYTYFVVQKNTKIYCYISNGKIYEIDYIDELELGFHEASCYVPTVVTDCKVLMDLNVSEEEILSSAVPFEGYNILSDYYKMSYNAYNPELSSDENGHIMKYPLLHSFDIQKCLKMKIIAELTLKDSYGATITTTHTIILEETDNGIIVEAAANEEDGLIMAYRLGELVFLEDINLDTMESKTAIINKSNEGLRNNLIITAPYLTSDEERAKVFGATQCEWFGGGTEGIAGGTRLFLGGNTSEGNKNLVVWSDLNNPLYFPENNYFSVGESSSAVTGFGKQSDMLVIFKENGSGIYYTKYQQNSDISAEDLIDQSVVDYVASSVYFPLVQINPNIGCSYPDTIQLCRNRLVWLGDNGNVYTLVSESQYNERSIFCVSEMVARDLKRNIKENATACDWEGYYCLMCGNKMYLMDYNCYGYTHVASYSKTEDANVRIPWYIWVFPFESIINVLDDKILMHYYLDAEIGTQCAILTYVLLADNESIDSLLCENEGDFLKNETHPIETVLRTKLFTFGEASTRKSVDKINLLLGNNGGEPITVKVITDQSEEEHDIYLTGTQTKAYTPGYIDSKAIFPTARNFLRVGLELSSEGVIAVDGMELKFRLLGGSR